MKENFLEFVGLKCPISREPSKRQKFLQNHVFILLGRVTGSTNVILGKLDRDRRLHLGENTCFRGFWGTLRSSPPETVKPHNISTK